MFRIWTSSLRLF